MYKIFKDPEGKKNIGIQKEENTWILFAPDNTDYQRFKEQVLDGAELQDADGNVMTQEQANEFIGSLP